jgi:hypothetical protein
MPPKKSQPDHDKLNRIVADAQRSRAQREQDYRERSLKMYPWVCGRCGREFTRENVHELTVHHRDHNHDNNPLDGSNWELLCLYCHDNEHARYVDNGGRGATSRRGEHRPDATHNPFAALKDMLDKKD